MKSAKNIKGLKSIGEIMPAALKKIQAGDNFSKYTVIINWEKIVGKEIAENTFVSDIDRRKLIIKVKNSVWSHHLMMLKEEIIQKINSYLGKNLINDLWFMAGYDKDNQNYKESKTALEEKMIIPMRLDEAEINNVKLIAEKISDKKIRAKISRLIFKDMALEKAKKADKWQPCLNCEVLVPPEKKYCTVCQINKKQRDAGKNKTGVVEKLLREAPWLTYDEIKRYVDSSPEEYNAAKGILARYYAQKIFNEGEGKKFQADLVMLLKEIKPENLTQVCIDSVIGEVANRLLHKRREKYVPASGS